MRLFMSGDYDFLCLMYGLSGASGKYSFMYIRVKEYRVAIHGWGS